jgi:hypothetical protein
MMIFILVSVIAITFLILLANQAPDGYQDAVGFHYRKKSNLFNSLI